MPVDLPTPEALRTELDGLAPEPRKVAAGLAVWLMREPGRARDQEALLEAYTRVAAEAIGAGDDQLERLRGFVREHRDAVVHAALGVFVRVAADLAAAGGARSLGQAAAVALGYFGEVLPGAPQSTAPGEPEARGTATRGAGDDETNPPPPR